MTPPALAESTEPESNPWAIGMAELSPDMDALGQDINARVKRAFERADEPLATESNDPAEQISTSARPGAYDLRTNINRSMSALLFNPIMGPSLSLQPLQEWEGHVTQIVGEKFRAALTDITAKQTAEDEQTLFLIDDLSDEDRQQLKIGAVFRWVIGYQRSAGGTKRRVSQITFRRLPAWTRKEILQADERAEQLIKTIVWE